MLGKRAITLNYLRKGSGELRPPRITVCGHGCHVVTSELFAVNWAGILNLHKFALVLHENRVFFSSV